MGRLLRVVLPGLVHHVWAHEHDLRRFFVSDEDRQLLIRLLRKAMERHGIRILCWCFMGTHFHLVVEDPRGELSRAMHLVNSVFARERNARDGTSGGVFRSRFGSKPVEDHDHFLELLRYVPINPAKAALCHDPAEWEYGSYRSVVTGRRDPLLDRERLFGLVAPGDPLAAREICIAVVEDGLRRLNIPPAGLPARLLALDRPSPAELRDELGIVEAVPAGRRFGYTQTELADALGLSRRQVQTLLK